MDAKSVIRLNLETAQMISLGYLSDLSDKEMLHRPDPSCNHINWQFGHLLINDHKMIEGCLAGSLQQLPATFMAKYAKELARSDNPSDFETKAVLLDMYHVQRQGIRDALEKVPADDLDKPGPEMMRSYAPTIGAAFTMVGLHWLMHAGQWAVIRRQLGRKPMF
ncbi:MAG TPA: DinB family protein [Pirellulaceae bacterium]|nr:DinB family protein [Pirellulaceae bacterium]HMO91087.1 DinB family protein [Pirellulaceae bacterium]HMP71186.1 DinB family protein [Pirellulaceae bacterium]